MGSALPVWKLENICFLTTVFPDTLPPGPHPSETLLGFCGREGPGGAMPGFCHSDPGELSFSSVPAGGWADLRGGACCTILKHFQIKLATRGTGWAGCIPQLRREPDPRVRPLHPHPHPRASVCLISKLLYQKGNRGTRFHTGSGGGSSFRWSLGFLEEEGARYS